MSHELAVSFTQLGFWSIIGVVLYIQYLCNHAQSIMHDAERVHRASIIRSPRPNDPFAFAKLDGGRRFLAILHAGARWEGKCIEPNAELPFRKIKCLWLGYLIVFKDNRFSRARWWPVSWLKRESTRPAGLPRLAIFCEDILDDLIATIRNDRNEDSWDKTGVAIQRNAEARYWFKDITYIPSPYTKGTREAERYHIDWLKAHMRTRLSPRRPAPPKPKTISLSEAIRIVRKAAIRVNLGDDQLRNYIKKAISEMRQEALVSDEKRVPIQKF